LIALFKKKNSIQNTMIPDYNSHLFVGISKIFQGLIITQIKLNRFSTYQGIFTFYQLMFKHKLSFLIKYIWNLHVNELIYLIYYSFHFQRILVYIFLLG
jgi:hypothetical protein